MGQQRKEAGLRVRLYRAIHAEGAKRQLDHDGVREVCRLKFGMHSLKELTDGQLQQVLYDWTGRALRATPRRLPKRGYAHAPGPEELVSAEDLELLGRAFSRRGWGPETRRAFVERVLGRSEIRTRRDWWRVFSGVRAMNRRDHAAA